MAYCNVKSQVLERAPDFFASRLFPSSVALPPDEIIPVSSAAVENCRLSLADLLPIDPAMCLPSGTRQRPPVAQSGFVQTGNL